MRMNPALIAGKLFALALFTAGAVDAAEIKVLASNALKTALEELGPQFEKASEHKLSFTFNAAVPLKAEIEKGVAFDVAILSAPITEDLVKQGKLVAATRADIARSGAGVAVKRGAPKPDISTTEAFSQVDLLCRARCNWNLSQGSVRAPRDRRAVEEQDQAAAAFQSCRACRGEW
jgi:molybdate transport system substrate-binding protein